MAASDTVFVTLQLTSTFAEASQGLSYIWFQRCLQGTYCQLKSKLKKCLKSLLRFAGTRLVIGHYSAFSP